MLLFVIAIFLAVFFSFLGSRGVHEPVRIPKYRPKRDHLGRTQRNYKGELIVEIYKYEEI